MTRHALWTLLTVLLASAPAFAQTGPTGAAEFAPSPVYAILFEAGRTFTYDVTARSSVYEPEGEGADEAGYVTSESTSTVTCTIAEVRPLTNALVATHTCVDEGQPVLGVSYVANPQGLWFVWDAPASDTDVAAELERGHLMLPPMPSATTETESTEYGGSEREVTSDPEKGWCARLSVWGGDESTVMRCVHEQRGISWATWSWAGGSSQDLEYVQQPAAPAP